MKVSLLRPRVRKSTGIFLSAQFSGLTNNVAKQGDHASITAAMSDSSTVTARAWGSSLGGSQYGTGTNPTDFSALAQGGLLYVRLTSGGETYDRAVASYVAPSVASAIADQSFTTGDADFTLDLDTVFDDATSYSVSGDASASIDGDGITLRIDKTSDVSATDITVTATNQLGAGEAVTDVFSLTIDTFSFSETNENTFEVDGATGDVTVTVTNPSAYSSYDAGNGAGIFIFDQADLADSPVPLVPPQIIDDGTPDVGDTLTLTPGLWAYDPDNGGIGSPTYQWQRDTSGNGTFTNIAGATSASYTLVSDDDGDDVRVIESLSDDAGTGTSNSAPVSIGDPASINSITADTSGIIIDYSGTLTMTGTPAGIELEAT